MLQPLPLDPKRHPICKDFNATTSDDVIKFAQFSKQQRQLVLPIYDDLQSRLALRLLPVRSRFWFLSEQIPNIQECPHEQCRAIETTFFDCEHSKELWDVLWENWRCNFEHSHMEIFGPSSYISSQPMLEQVSRYNSSLVEYSSIARHYTTNVLNAITYALRKATANPYPLQ
ncbi:Pol Polyprotein [Phytophthora megakarya]|uniref:Pol Polyprotein n=1 Tax=Phytophthora megakarya TaxID=4795 RepID=A0A225UNJ1_9STRA|nr:Pol Polyprotein [Phytophthora megakarya]